MNKTYKFIIYTEYNLTLLSIILNSFEMLTLSKMIQFRKKLFPFVRLTAGRLSICGGRT